MKKLIDETSNPWTKINSRKIYENPWIEVHEDKVLNPSGGEGIYGTVHFRNKAIGIIPLDNDRNTWLIGQYRYPLNEYSWEIPMGGGLLQDNELNAAKRELKEETGLTANSWDLVLKIHTSNSVTDEVGFIFLAQDLTEGETEFDDTEELQIRKVPFSEVLHMAMAGEITDGISLAGIFKVARLLNM